MITTPVLKDIDEVIDRLSLFAEALTDGSVEEVEQTVDGEVVKFHKVTFNDHEYISGEEILAIRDFFKDYKVARKVIFK